MTTLFRAEETVVVYICRTECWLDDVMGFASWNGRGCDAMRYGGL